MLLLLSRIKNPKGLWMKTLLLTVISFILLALHPVYSEEIHKEENHAPLKLGKSAVNIIYPIAYYSPETRIAAGFQFNHIFHPGRKKPASRPSRIIPTLIYTQNKQIKAEIRTDLYLNNESTHIKSSVNYKNYPEIFYGVGNDTRFEDEEKFTSSSWEIFLGIEKKFTSGFYVGGQYHFQDWTITDTKNGGLISEGDIPGTGGGRISGLGFIINRDTRDNLFYPLNGDFFSVSFRLYRHFLGGTFDFSILKIDLRKYIHLFSRHVLGFQAVFEISSGTPPFHMLAQLGGADLMRGFYMGRYRDNHLLALQAEYRFPLFWRLGMVVFGGFGEVAESLNQFDIHGLKHSVGFGFRYLFNKQEQINARMDIGFGDEKTRVYMDAPEAF
jgi:hypothetical protein